MRVRGFRGSYAVLTVYALIVLLPLLDLLFLSFKSLPEIIGQPFSPPSSLQPGNYADAWTQGNLGTYLFNTAVVSVVSVGAIILLASMAAYAIARFEFPGNQVVYMFFLAGLALPIQMIAVPLFILMRQLDLVNNLLSLILIYTASGLSFSVFLLVSFVRNIPRALDESAFLDGANEVQVYWHIIFPLLRPALTVVALLNFLTTWNGFFFPLILLTDPSKMTVAVGVLSFVGQYATQWNLLLPALVIVMIPTVIIFAVAAKQFVRNMTGGALKV